MATLDNWRCFLASPKTIHFPKLELIAGDADPPVVSGVGELRIPDLHQFEFTLDGCPSDTRHALQSLRAMRETPYDGRARLRLFGTAADGPHWVLGWTTPRAEPSAGTWRFQGELEMIGPARITHDGGPGTELLFVIPPASQTHFDLIRSFDRAPYRQELEVLGARISITYEPDQHVLSIVATPSDDLPLTYAENWLSEPLRILFGQILTPRLVARNLPDGTAQVLISILAKTGRSNPAGLWNGATTDRKAFWQTYARLLTYLAVERRGGKLDIEPHKLTRLYEELSLAAAASRWVWAMVLASSTEALTTLMAIPVSQTAAEKKTVDELLAHIKGWKGNADLRQVATNAVHHVGTATTLKGLRHLANAGVISKNHVDAWRELRNSVMHGELVSPYSSEEEDNRLIALGELFHKLTYELLRRAVPEPTPVTSSAAL